MSPGRAWVELEEADGPTVELPPELGLDGPEVIRPPTGVPSGLRLPASDGNDLTGLTGKIPPELSKLVKLEGLDLSGNDLTGGIPGVIVVSESHAGATEALARMAPGVEVAALGAAAHGTPGVSPMTVGEALPFRTGVARGVALAASDATPSAAEAARVLAPGARVLVTESDARTRAMWEKTGLRTWVDEEGTLVLRTR